MQMPLVSKFLCVLEGFGPQRVAVDIMNDYDVFVAKTGDLWEMPHLIGVHCLSKFVSANKYIPFAFMWGWGGSVKKHLEWFLFGGAYALSLTTHVSLLHFFRLWDIVCNIRDVDQGPRVVMALLDCFEPRLFHWESHHCM